MAADRTGKAWRVADALFLLMFTFSVVVQVNDPDPLPWILMYGAAAVACLLALTGRLPWWFAVLTALVALGWALTLAPRVIGNIPFLSMFEEFEMKDVGVEESREMYGLLMIAAWMAVLGHRSFWLRRSRQIPV
jgi:hypothetical protein